MNKVYLYDGYYNLINLILELLKNKIEPDNIKDIKYEPSLLDEVIYLKQDFNNLNEFKKFNKDIIHACYYAFLSNRENKEMIMYVFLKNALKYKENVFKYRNIDEINEIIKIVKYVGSEAHKLKGFLRFKKVKNYYYATYESTNNVLPILANHFKNRLASEYFIIKDESRNIYAIYDLKKVNYIRNSELKLEFNDDSYFEVLWKNYFKITAIKERENLKCQMNFMPKKYWNHMLEMENEYEKNNRE